MHQSVLLSEAIDALVTDGGGYYVDGTFGRGGHSERVLSVLNDKGRLLAFDKDPVAAESAELLRKQDGRFDYVQGSFAELGEQLAQREVTEVAGILLDLGVSSPQLDDAERGFSFMQDGPLDMRMDSSSGISAAEWIAVAEESEIARVLKEYGEERYSKRIARAIVGARSLESLTRTLQLAEVVKEANPAWEKHKHPATRSFQAIRIYINRELEDLKDILAQAVELLGAGGRLVVISFHSLEDRLVKRFIRRMVQGDPLPARVPVRELERNRRMKSVGKAVKAKESEVDSNIRSRSAVMRVAEKLP